MNESIRVSWRHWDPTSDDFESFGAGVVNGLGELSGSKLLSLQKMSTVWRVGSRITRRLSRNKTNSFYY